MLEQMQDHFNDEEIIKLNIEQNMARWEYLLEFNETEIEFLTNLLLSKRTDNSEQVDFLLQKMEEVKETNTLHKKTFLDFKINLEGRRECDEIECETHYVKQYFVLKEILLKYFQAFRDEKSGVYAYFKEL